MLKSRLSHSSRSFAAVAAGLSACAAGSLPARAAEEGGENIGFPQLNTSTYPTQLFWLFVSFLLIYALMSKLALPRVSSVLDARHAQREGNLQKAQAAQEEAAGMTAAFEASLAQAQAEAQRATGAVEQDVSETAAAEYARFGEHARKRISSAEQAIARAKKEALTSLADISADIAAEMVQKISGMPVGKAEAKKAVTSAMEQ